jgi:hypothetical protein
VLVPEVQARRALRGRRIRLRVLAPYGSWTGCGTLRVLRLKINEPLIRRQAQDETGQDDSEVELTVGYESYRP